MIYKIRDLVGKMTGEWGEEGSVETGVKVIRTANFTNDGSIDFSNLVYRKIEPRKVEIKRLRPGDIIIEKSGGSPTQPVGRVVYFDIDSEEPYLCNNFTSILRPNKALVDPKYLFYRLLINHRFGLTRKFQNKTTGIINLKLEHYLEEKMMVPNDREVQIRIASILSKAEALIRQRKESIRLLDEFLKSTFLEMFGDPVRNDKGWSTALIRDHVNVLTGYPFKSQAYLEDNQGIKLCGGLIIQPDKIAWESAKYWSWDKVDDLKKYALRENDIVMAMDRPWISTGFKIRMISANDLPALLVQRTARLRSDKFDQFYLYYAFRHKSFENHAKPTETTVPHISPNDITTFNISIPPVKLQTQFGHVVRKTEVLKSQYQVSLQELENLYASLSQRAFNGELVNSTKGKIVPLMPVVQLAETNAFRKRKVLATYIINQSLSDPKFGDTKFQKLLHLSDYHAVKRDLGQKYFQQTAGPNDNAFTRTYFTQIGGHKWFKRKKEGSQFFFSPGVNHAKSREMHDYFSSEELQRVDALIKHFGSSDYTKPEIISTLYSVWNNRIIKAEPVSDELLKQDFLNWDIQKKKYKDKLDAALAWMRKEGIVPDGWGSVIEKAKTRKGTK